mmetsp:Transcript_11706/g.31544  ORF Transcript_11706/g.31544 Transcript_11706/m.31544 type:complete len:218 (-) Transcript_11706:1140-1793(-)
MRSAVAPAVLATSASRGFIAGNRRTSLIALLSVRNMIRRSIPRPQPPVGGKPYSRAVQKSSSVTIASSSPPAASCADRVKRSRCTIGLFNSVYALHSSRPQTKSSKRSVIPGSERWLFASGLIISGWSQINVGLTHSISRNSPTSLSSIRAVVSGGEHTTLCLAHNFTRAAFAASKSRSRGTASPNFSSSAATMLIRRNGGVKSSSRTRSVPGPSGW